MSFRIFKCALIVLAFCLSCDQLAKKEEIIKPSEIGVYYDSKSDKLIVLKPGKHQIPISVTSWRYPRKPVFLSVNSSVLAKDESEVNLKVVFKYSIKRDQLIDLHMYKGPNYEDDFVVPLMHTVTRNVIGRYDAKDLDLKIIEKEMLINTQTYDDFSKFIKVESIKLAKD